MLVDDGLNQARWAVVSRAWHRGGRLTRVTLGGAPTRWRVASDELDLRMQPDGLGFVVARVLRVTR